MEDYRGMGYGSINGDLVEGKGLGKGKRETAEGI